MNELKGQAKLNQTFMTDNQYRQALRNFAEQQSEFPLNILQNHSSETKTK